MSRRLILLLAFLLASCADPQPVPTARTESTPTISPPARAPEIRFALVGKDSSPNVWALFDERGATYVNYAVRAGYWPRLYALSLPDHELQPQAAKDMPSAIQQEGEFHTAIVALRDDLKWSDGSDFTAQDAAFTVQYALAFRLSFDWKAYYNNNILDRAEALDNHTVKFYFKQKPNIAAWQYGVLQSPILQRTYWQDKIRAAAALLPDDSLRQQIAEARAEAELLQKEIDRLMYVMYTTTKNGPEYGVAEIQVRKHRDNLGAANNKVAKLQNEYDAKMNAAHEALFALDAKDEPLLGAWLPDGEGQSAANPSFPFGQPSFERVAYRFYDTEDDALSALQNNDVDFALLPNGISHDVAQQLSKNSGITVARNPSSRARYLAFNLSHPELADTVFRRALDCVINRSVLTDARMEERAFALDSFLPAEYGFWQNPQARSECSGKSDAERVTIAVEMLKAAGYSWVKEPAPDITGRGLTMPTGASFPNITLLAPSSEFDPLRATAAKYIVKQAAELGIPIKENLAAPDDVLYAVYSSGKYDMALLGWKLSSLPSFLCEWFEGKNPFGYVGNKPPAGENESLVSACNAFHSASGLDEAREASFKIQSILIKDAPLIPLYSVAEYEAYRNIRYPFGVLDGFTELFGIPILVTPGN